MERFQQPKMKKLKKKKNIKSVPVVGVPSARPPLQISWKNVFICKWFLSFSSEIVYQ
jgi:hypothetical protein